MKSYPRHKFLTPENLNATFTEDEYVWIIEAIDGTNNYLHRLPYFALSIAVKHKNKLQHAVVYDPIREDLFTASRGEGAFLNDHRIRVSPHKTIDDALLGTKFPYRQILEKNDSIRCGGSTALDLAYVAASRLEGFWGSELNELEMSAGALLILEAGGLIGDFQGEEKYLESGTMVAGNPKIFKAIVQGLQNN